MTAIIDVRLLHSRCCMISQLVGMCGIDFLFQFGFGSFFLNSDSVQNVFGSVRFKKMRFGSDIIVIY